MTYKSKRIYVSLYFKYYTNDWKMLSYYMFPYSDINRSKRLAINSSDDEITSKPT